MITTADNDNNNNNNLNDYKYEKKGLTPWNPYVIDMSTVLTGISTIAADDADDDSDWWTLQGFKIGRKPTQPGVYIHHGNKVTIKRVK